jgi:hypothetical protein
MAGYGRDVARTNGVASAYIPHGVDTSLFRPAPDKAEAKRALGYDGRFVILSDARNQPRKMLPRTLEVFRRFAAGKDDVILHLHCDPNDPVAKSPEYHYDIASDIELLGLSDKVRFTNGMSMVTGIPLTDVAAIYQAADIHLLSSWGEGFGLPTLQAAAAGVVPMASAYTASQELVEGHGEAIRVQRFLPDQFGIQRAMIDLNDAVAKIEALYRDRERLARKSEESTRFAQQYDWKRIVPRWHELLERELSRLRNKARYAQVVSRVTIGSRQDGPPTPAIAGDLNKAVRAAFTGLPEGATVTVNVVESKLGELAVDVLRDAATHEQELRIPVTLPSPDPALVEHRTTGCVYAASQSDVPVLVRLSRVFPGLSVWSTQSLQLGPDVQGKPTSVKPVPAGSSTYRKNLAASTLALDLDAVDPRLPLQAAELGVPCIGICRNPDQVRVWPGLSLGESDPAAALELARLVLTDQGEAADHCRQACAAMTSLATAGSM